MLADRNEMRNQWEFTAGTRWLNLIEAVVLFSVERGI